MMIAFWTVSALFTAGALLFVLPPLLARHEASRVSRGETNVAIYRDQLRELDADLAAGVLSAEQHEKAQRELEARVIEDVPADVATAAPVRHGRGAAIVMSVAVPVLIFALYFAVGNPQALFSAQAVERGEHGMTAQQVEALVERLAARMKANPADAEGWILLGRSYGALGRFTQAAQAYSNALAHLPRDAELLADYADMLAMAQGRRLQGEPERIIARALAADPNNLKALSLAGSAAFEKKAYTDAIRYWDRILPLVPPGSDGAQAIQASITEARKLGGAAPDGRATRAR
ncbi:MAG: c-type cytochrome biogenesis protein CcmI [Betaproteobacteria bacterium]|nr:c-type cytochrome biogenesis protein CcmI [Betaproteobacteria bacterium]